MLGALTVNAGTGTVSITENDAIGVASIAHTGNLTLNAAGAIAQTGTVVVSGTSSFAAGANAITLTNPGNDFGGAVTFSNSGANAVQIADVNNISIGTSTLGGNFTVTAAGGAGTVTLGSITNSGFQQYNGNAVLNSTYTTNGGAYSISGTTTLGDNTTINTSSGNVTFASTIDGGFSLAVNDSGTNNFVGDIGSTTPLANITTDAPGLSMLAGDVRVTGSINLLDLTTASGATMTSTGGGAVTVNNASATSPAFISTSGSVTLGGTMIGSVGDPLDFSVTPGSLTMTQQVIAFFAGPAIPASVVFPAGSSITYNGAVIAQSILQQQASSASSQVAATVSAAVTEEANKTFGTDSVAEDVEYGFAGEVGTTPPMDHRIDEAGISLPHCVEEAREGVPCK